MKFDAIKKLFESNKHIQNNRTKKVPDATTYTQNLKYFTQNQQDLFLQKIKIFKLTTFVSVGFNVFFVIMILMMIPLKTTVPYVLRVDKLGNTQIVEPTHESISHGKALDKHFINSFMNYYYNYNYNSVQNYFNYVKALSNDSVFSVYNHLMRDKDTSPALKFEDRDYIKVNIQNIQFLPSSKNHDQEVLVRFSTEIYNADGSQNSNYAVINRLATLSFNYDKKITNSSDKLMNPLGFQITSLDVQNQIS